MIQLLSLIYLTYSNNMRAICTRCHRRKEIVLRHEYFSQTDGLKNLNLCQTCLEGTVLSLLFYPSLSRLVLEHITAEAAMAKPTRTPPTDETKSTEEPTL